MNKYINVKMSQMCCVYKEHNFAKVEKYFAVIYWVLHCFAFHNASEFYPDAF